MIRIYLRTVVYVEVGYSKYKLNISSDVVRRVDSA